MAEEVLLFSLEAEMTVLGAMLLGAGPRGVNRLRPEYFFRPAHRVLFRAMVDVHQAGHEIEFLPVKERLSEQGLLADVGGEDYLLSVCEYTVGASSLDYAADRVEELWRLRGMDESVTRFAQGLRSGAYTADEAWAELSTLARGYEGSSQDLFLVRSGLLSEREEVWLECGLPVLDEKGLGGGILPKGCLSVVAAKSSHGKTAFLTQTTAHLCLQGKRGMFATLEMSRRQVTARLVQNLSGWSKPPRTLDTHAMWEAAGRAIDCTKLVIWDPSKRAAEHKTIEALVQQVHKVHDQVGLDFLAVDYYQLFTTAAPWAAKSDNRVRELVVVADQLLSLAKQLDIAVVTGAQLRRDDDKGEPQIADCSQLFKNAQIVVYLALPKVEDRSTDTPTWRAKAALAKNRDGQTGPVDLRYRWGYARFEDPTAPLPMWSYDPFEEN